MYRYSIFLILFSFDSMVLSQSGWIQQNTNIYNNLYDLSFINDDTGWVVGSGSSILRSVDGGTTWNILTISNSITPRCIKLFSNNVAILGANYYYQTQNYGAIFTTSNSGVTWINRFMTQYTSPNRIFFLNQNIGWIAGAVGLVLKTTNGGINWIEIHENAAESFFGIFFIDEHTGWVAGEINSINHKLILKKTTNSGVNWDIQMYSTSDFRLNSVFFTDYQNGCTVGLGGRVYLTSNSGSNWERIYTTTNKDFTDVYFVNNSTGFIVGEDGVIYKSINSGLNWSYQQGGNLSYDLEVVQFTGSNTGYVVGSGGSILKTTNGGEPIGISPISTEIPSNYELHQNYPNPFNPSTQIKFDLPKSSFVKLIVYDVLGKEVTSLVNEELNLGEYSVDWNAVNFPSGVYFYTLISDDFIQNKKMILIK